MADGGRRALATEETFLAAYTGRRSRRHHDRELLTFALGGETYALDMTELREISRMREITELPRVPAFLLGVITLRGLVIPVLDLRRRMRLPPVEPSRETRILIVDQDGEPFGLVVDRVVRVERVDNPQIESAPLPSGVATDFVAGVARVEGELIVLLELAQVVGFKVGTVR